MIGLLLFACLLAGPAAAQRRVEVYKVQFRTAHELLPLAAVAMGSSEGVTLDRGTNSLVLIGDPATVAEALALLARQDQALHTVVIRYESMRSGELVERGYEIRWHAVRGDFRIGNVRVRSASDASVDLRATEEMRSLAESFESTMRVTEGARTRIEAGLVVPFGVKGRSGPSTEYVDVVRGFEADARILGDGRVAIDLVGFGAKPTGEGGSIATTSASTRLVVTPGESVAVGGLVRSRDADRVDRSGSRLSASRQDETVLLLHVELE